MAWSYPLSIWVTTAVTAVTVFTSVTFAKPPLDFQSGINFSNLPEVKALQVDMPEPVQKFIVRQAECIHWDEQPIYGKEKKEFIKKMKDKSGCKTIDLEYEKLRKEYDSDAAVKEVLQKARNLAL